MQMVFFSEDTPQGQTVEWPIVPREGEKIEFSHPGGQSILIVDDVFYHANTDGGFHSVSVHLKYEPSRKIRVVSSHGS
jgi:hypothetical protein